MGAEHETVPDLEPTTVPPTPTAGPERSVPGPSGMGRSVRRAISSPKARRAGSEPVEPDPVHRLQRAMGNQALQRVARADPSASSVRDLLGQLRSGRPLPEAVQASFGRRMGRDLGGVRIHTGARAAATAQRLRADAFTVGRDIGFATGRWAPETRAGKQLLGHELTHVLQRDQPGRGRPRDAEAQARRVGERVATGGGMGETPVPGGRGLARQEAGGSAAARGGPAEEIGRILSDPFWVIEDAGKPYRILNGLSVAHMLGVLQTLSARGHFRTLYGAFQTFAAGVHRGRLEAAMKAVSMRGHISSAAFCVRYSHLLATIEIEGVEAILVHLGGLPPRLRIGEHHTVGEKSCALCDSDIRCGGSRSWRGNNPGNLTFGVSDLAYSGPKSVVPGGPAQVAIFPNYYVGLLALHDWIEGLGNRTIRSWVDHQLGPNPQPPDDPNRYAAEVARMLGTVPSATLGSVDAARFAEVVQRIEGWSPGEAYDWGQGEAPDEIITIRAGVLYTGWKEGAAR